PEVEPGEGEAREGEEERCDAVLDVHRRDAVLMPEEAGHRERLGWNRQVHDRDGDEHEAEADGRPGEKSIRCHSASLRAWPPPSTCGPHRFLQWSRTRHGYRIAEEG